MMMGCALSTVQLADLHVADGQVLAWNWCGSRDAW